MWRPVAILVVLLVLTIPTGCTTFVADVYTGEKLIGTSEYLGWASSGRPFLGSLSVVDKEGQTLHVYGAWTLVAKQKRSRQR